MALIGALVLQMRATTDKLQSGLNAGKNKILDFGKSLSSMTDLGSMGMKSLGLAAGGAAAAIAAAGLTIKNTLAQMQKLDEQVKSADSLGLTINQFRGLALGADLSGVAVENLSTSMGRMLKVIGDAKGGSEAAQEALSKLGISISELSGRDTFTQFSQIAEAIKQIPDPAERAAAAMAIFGRSAIDLMPLLSEGKEGMEGFVEESKELGGSFTREDIKRIEEANDSITRLKASWDGLFTALAVPVSKPIEVTMTAATKAITHVKKLTGESIGLIQDLYALSPLSNGKGRVASVDSEESAPKPFAQVGEAEEAIDKLAKKSDELVESLKLQRDTFGMTSAEVEIYKAKLAGVSHSKLVEAEIIAYQIKQLEEEKEAREKAARAAEEQTKAQLRAMEEMRRAQERLMEEAKSIFLNTRSPIEQYRLEVMRLQQFLSAGLIDPETFKRGVLDALPEQVKSVIEDTKSPIQKFNEQMKELETLRKQGFLSDDQFRLAGNKLVNEFAQPVESGGFARSLQAGSAEARRAILGKAPKEKELPTIAKATQEQLGVAKENLRVLNQMNQKLETASIP